MSNVRDLGGLQVTDGRRVRPGVLLRSEAPMALDDDGRALLAAVPARLVVDLRMHGEGPPATGIWPEHELPETVVLELLPRVGVPDAEPGDPLGPLIADASGAATRAYVTTVYESIVEMALGGVLFEVVRRIADDSQLPVVLHCTAGQDRTGVLIALLLRGLGVPYETVVEDYLVTVEHFTRDRIRDWALDLSPAGTIVPAGVLDEFLAAEHYLEHSLRLAEDREGGIRGFFAEAGVDAAQLERLRNAVLDESRVA